MTPTVETGPGSFSAAEQLAQVFALGSSPEILAALAATDRETRGSALRSFLVGALAGKTALQRHLLPFDADGDDHLSWGETRAGFRAVGMDAVVSAAAATATHIVMGFRSSDRLFSWNISLKLAELSRHAADTGAFAEELTEDALKARVDSILREFDSDGDGLLDAADLERLVAANIAAERSRGRSWLPRRVGEIASGSEFRVLMRLAGTDQPDGRRLLKGTTLHDLYGGMLMFQLLPDDALTAALIRVRADADRET